jgi:hypothetical protein
MRLLVKILVLPFLFVLLIYLLYPFSVFSQEQADIFSDGLTSDTALAENNKRYFLPAISETLGSNALFFSL